jgi:hypothetical protein
MVSHDQAINTPHSSSNPGRQRSVRIGVDAKSAAPALPSMK